MTHLIKVLIIISLLLCLSFQGKNLFSLSESGDVAVQCYSQGYSMEERADYLIQRLRKGDRKAFLYIEYNLLDNGKKKEGVIRWLYSKAKSKKTTIARFLTQDKPKIRKNVVRAVISGLFNKDPKVRLVAVNLLRRLGPNKAVARQVRRAYLLEVFPENHPKYTYLYISRDNPETLNYANHSVIEKFIMLDMFITRAILVNQIKKGNVNILKNIKKEAFRTLFYPIDNDFLTHLPVREPHIKQYSKKEVKAIIIGMTENKDKSIREDCAYFLYALKRFGYTNLTVKKKIETAIKKAIKQKLISDPGKTDKNNSDEKKQQEKK